MAGVSEHALGSGRTDLLIEWPAGVGPETQRVATECKGRRDRVMEEGLQQLRRYMDRCGAQERHRSTLTLFRGRRDFSENAEGLPITVRGM